MKMLASGQEIISGENSLKIALPPTSPCQSMQCWKNRSIKQHRVTPSACEFRRDHCPKAQAVRGNERVYQLALHLGLIAE